MRLLVSTNAGFVHMFTDSGNTVTENWAFIAKDLLSYGLAIKDVGQTSTHSYGMDLSPVIVRHIDENTSEEKIIAVFGMRRGGSKYFALDITNASAPRLLWQINATDHHFTELAQTWSLPTAGRVKYSSGNTEHDLPVLIFGGGYDTNKDSCNPSRTETCDDSIGRAIYMVNALTGEYIWSAESPSLGCVKDDIHCIRDSIAAPATLLDSNFDGYTDRVYIGDTGGNVWRADFVGLDKSKWSLIKFASLGGDTAQTDRRIFSAPVIARTYADKVSVVDNQYVYKDDSLRWGIDRYW